ncbi:MAG: M48 family metalloprotease [Gemmatimonadetes bacterium]|nr:M48 family metalloprotease [Gemmatimonadota bacterium]
MSRRTRSGLPRLRGAVTAVLAAAVAGCAVNPATGERQLSLIGEGREIEMGREYDRGVVSSLGLYPDSVLQEHVAALGRRLAMLSERPSLPWAFRVVDDPVVNAFALPGGFIYITRGILAHFGSEAQLAAVLGHEIGHVTARHSVSQMSKQQLAQLGLGVGAILAPEVAGYADVAQAALGVLFLKFSRDDERQADDLGLRYMRRASYDPREMISVFTMLDRVSAPSGRTPDWLSTHPNPENRRERIEQRVTGEPPGPADTIVNRDAYLARLDGLVYGENPREGFFRGSEFLHPELRFRLTFPEGWSGSNQKQAVVAVAPGKDAIMQLSLAEETTPAAAARRFFAQEGVADVGWSAGEINGLPAAAGSFAAVGEGGRILGSVAFVAYAAAVYRLLGYAGEAQWRAHQGAADRAIRSFRPLTDPAALGVQPWRMRVVRIDRSMTVREFAERYPGPVTADVLAQLNNVAANARLEPGVLMKRVEGQRLP